MCVSTRLPQSCSTLPKRPSEYWGVGKRLGEQQMGRLEGISGTWISLTVSPTPLSLPTRAAQDFRDQVLDEEKVPSLINSSLMHPLGNLMKCSTMASYYLIMAISSGKGQHMHLPRITWISQFMPVKIEGYEDQVLITEDGDLGNSRFYFIICF